MTVGRRCDCGALPYSRNLCNLSRVLMGLTLQELTRVAKSSQIRRAESLALSSLGTAMNQNFRHAKNKNAFLLATSAFILSESSPPVPTSCTVGGISVAEGSPLGSYKPLASAAINSGNRKLQTKEQRLDRRRQWASITES